MVNKSKKKVKKSTLKNHHTLEQIFKKFMRLGHFHQLGFLFIVFLGTVMVWRGIYNLLNHYWLISYPLVSNISSIMIGLVIVASTHYAVRKII